MAQSAVVASRLAAAAAGAAAAASAAAVAAAAAAADAAADAAASAGTAAAEGKEGKALPARSAAKSSRNGSRAAACIGCLAPESIRLSCTINCAAASFKSRRHNHRLIRVDLLAAGVQCSRATRLRLVCAHRPTFVRVDNTRCPSVRPSACLPHLLLVLLLLHRAARHHRCRPTRRRGVRRPVTLVVHTPPHSCFIVRPRAVTTVPQIAFARSTKPYPDERAVSAANAKTVTYTDESTSAPTSHAALTPPTPVYAQAGWFGLVCNKVVEEDRSGGSR